MAAATLPLKIPFSLLLLLSMRATMLHLNAFNIIVITTICSFVYDKSERTVLLPLDYKMCHSLLSTYVKRTLFDIWRNLYEEKKLKTISYVYIDSKAHKTERYH